MLEPGDDVIIDFEGVDHEGHVEKIEHGWCRAKILLDPELDYGTSSSRLSPHQTVCVPLSRVRPRA